MLKEKLSVMIGQTKTKSQMVLGKKQAETRDDKLTKSISLSPRQQESLDILNDHFNEESDTVSQTQKLTEIS